MDVASGARALSTGSAAGNRFWLWDGFLAPAPPDPAAEARILCGEDGRDGLLLVLPASDSDADCRMVLYNADGSRAETCGNGLRLVGKHLYETGRVAGTRLRVRTDVGTGAVELFVNEASGEVDRARVELGPPRDCRALELEADSGAEPLRATFVDLGNPHCVLFGDRELLGSLPELGPRLERLPIFPDRANIELARADPERADTLLVRVWERGVGETRACGSGACAAALAAVERGLASWPVTVEMEGGELRVERDERGLWLEGPVEDR